MIAALDHRFAAGAPGQAALDELLDADLVTAVAGVRERVATALRRAVTAAVRAARPDGCEVLLHADTNPLATGANVGVDVRSPGADLDGLILSVSGELAPMAGRLRTAVADCPPGARIGVTVQAVRGMTGDPVPRRGAGRGGPLGRRRRHHLLPCRVGLRRRPGPDPGGDRPCPLTTTS